MDSLGVTLRPELILCTIIQDGRRIEDYVEEFLKYGYLTAWKDHILINCFINGLDDYVCHCQLLPEKNEYGKLEQFLDLVLWRCGSTY